MAEKRIPSARVIDGDPIVSERKPTARIVDVGEKEKTVTDSLGRRITARKLSLLEKMNLFSLIGGDNCNNQLYLAHAVAVYSVSEIDGIPVPTPATMVAFNGNVNRLGDEGLSAVGDALAALNTATIAPDEQAKNS